MDGTHLATGIRHPAQASRSYAAGRVAPNMVEVDLPLRRSARLDALAWGLAAVGAMTLAGVLQVSQRAPLAWDEAARVSSGMQLSFALEHLSPGEVWAWFSAQGFYPFLEPSLHGLAYLVTGNPVAAAWLPALAAYGLAGVLVGRLALALGAGNVGAWIAAVLFWLAPIEVKVAAGAMSESLGVCVEVGAVLLLVRLEGSPTVSRALALGVVLGLAWWIKYDYGLLTTGTVGVASLLRLLSARRFAALVPYALAIGTGLVLFGAALLPGISKKVSDLGAFLGTNAPGSSGTRFIGTPWSADAHVDFLYYLRQLFPPGWLDLTPVGEVAFTTLVAGFFLAGVGWALFAARKRPAVLPPLVFVLLWVLVYSLAVSKFPRFAATLTPFLVALAAAALMSGWREMRARRIPRYRLAAVCVAALLASQFALQLPRVGDRFAFIAPNPTVSEALAFIRPQLPRSEGGRRLLMIGPTNELGPGSVKIVWSQELGGTAPHVGLVPEAPATERRRLLMRKLSRARPAEIVGVRVEPGSRLDTSDFRHTWPSQPDYYRAAVHLERTGLLRRVARTTTTDHTLEVTLWQLAPHFDRRRELLATRGLGAGR